MVGEGVTVFVTTHYMDEAEYCNRLALLDRGRIVAMGTPSGTQEPRHERRNCLLVECEPLGPALESLTSADRRAWTLQYSETACTSLYQRGSGDSADSLHFGKEERSSAEDQEGSFLPSIEDVFVSLTCEQDRHKGRRRHEVAAHRSNHAEGSYPDLP